MFSLALCGVIQRKGGFKERRLYRVGKDTEKGESKLRRKRERKMGEGKQ